MKYARFFISEVSVMEGDKDLISRSFSIDATKDDIRELKDKTKIRPYLICIHPLSKKYKNSPVVMLGEFTCGLNDLEGKNIHIYAYDLRIGIGWIKENFSPNLKIIEKDGEILKVWVKNSSNETIVFDSVKNFSSKDIERLEDENPNLLKFNPEIRQSVLRCINDVKIDGKILSFYSFSEGRTCSVDLLELENYLLNICKLTEQMLVNHVKFRNLTLEKYMGLNREEINRGFKGVDSISRLAAEYLRKSDVGNLMKLCSSVIDPFLYSIMGDYGNGGGILWQASKNLKGNVYKVDLNSAYAEPLMSCVPIPQLVPEDKKDNAITFYLCKISNFKGKNEGFKQFTELNNFLRMQEKDNQVTIWDGLLNFLREVADFEIEIFDTFYFRKVNTSLSNLLKGINNLRGIQEYKENCKSVLQRLYGKLCQRKGDSEDVYRSRIAGCYITQFVQLKLMKTIYTLAQECPDIKFGHVNTDGFIFQTKSQKGRESIVIDHEIGDGKVESDRALEYIGRNPAFYLIENNDHKFKVALSGLPSISLIKKMAKENKIRFVKKYVANPKRSRFLTLRRNSSGGYTGAPSFLEFGDDSSKVTGDFITNSIINGHR